MANRASQTLFATVALAVAASCTRALQTGESPTAVAHAAESVGALDRRGDSLIARLLNAPGEIWSGGNVYSFQTDQRLLTDLTALGMHAVPQLIDCMSDDRPSRVTYSDPRTNGLKTMSRGAVCFEALVGTWFFQMREDTLLERVERGLGCDADRTEGPIACTRGHVGYYATMEELRRGQRIWRAYLTEYRASGRPVLPRLGQTAVGCYSLRLQPNHPGPLAVDTSRRFSLELDTLPLPGTLRPNTLRLSDSIEVGGMARWSAHYENRVLLSWDGPDRNAHFGLNFGGTDSALAGYWLMRPNASARETFGKLEVARVPCRSDQRRR